MRQPIQRRIAIQSRVRPGSAAAPINSRRLLTHLIALLLGSTLTAAADAQDDGIQSDAVYQSWLDHSGVKECGQCHYQRAATFANLDTSLSRQDELKFWLAQDKHAIARRRVEPLSVAEIDAEADSLIEKYGAASGIVSGWLGASNVLSKRICDKLGYDVQQPSGINSFRDNCLSCHGGYRNDVEADKQSFAQGQPGISCNYCHQVGDNDDWIQAHGLAVGDERTQWRANTPAQKESLGMRDLVTASRQANLCFDCHIGNRAKNMFVTHQMYAAGHPPLPSIELQTFTEQMPRHWQSVSETERVMADQFKAPFFQANFPSVENPGSTYWNTRALLIGALVARAKTVDQLIDSHSLDRWADYSLYDCAACHHELQRQSERQHRGFPSAPGRPRLSEWANLQLVQIGAFLVDDEPQLMQAESQLIERVGEKPFGDAARVAESATQLRGALQTAIERAESTAVDEQIALGVLRGLAGTPRDRLLSYDSARQLVWAIQVVAAELKADGKLSDELEQIVSSLADPDSSGLITKLPAGRNQFIYQDGLRADLLRRANFDPSQLENQLKKLSAAIDPSLAANR